MDRLTPLLRRVVAPATLALALLAVAAASASAEPPPSLEGPVTDHAGVLDTGAVADRNGLLFTLAHSNLSAAADYVLRVSGTAAGFGGNYGVLLNVGGVSQVPLPPAIWLFISAVVGLVSVARRRRHRVEAAAA